ncbi:hypothetical protein LX15_003113 [Streptoalloteichus tenebrarius]|uniref:Uncharacterized protein n=1 Tax=Streptoalloteichus tenebrarius (strain ATCC 17920 / DSM 40477 / JCM 4838 / CBS 697.72 / NBRC 16177 / NCIMB 11028 / NRRL B-12390 / A12253. 1 / ISP 5477) TaxID=1933 RepID=A0ABT1HV52_STRSD|nr:hypothetical protein [Streptoalloteichus tenebrarius]MCP2259412.1 hypothetical protein [Streptoalloteichus tenebrarius]BFF02354.1 hypothetical protein GCM10020241_40290 [Streptoalloteichus tenebrarius]
MPLGLTKIGRAAKAKAGRHHQPESAEVAGGEPDRDLDSYLAALAPESEVETTGSGRRFGNAQVYQLRLSLKANERLRQLAEERESSPLALATEWIMQRLEQETHEPRAAWKTYPNLRPVGEPAAEATEPGDESEWETARHDWRL